MATKKDIIKMLEAFEDDAVMEISHTIMAVPAPKSVNVDSAPTIVAGDVSEV